MGQQLISCLTVSKPDRWGLLQRAVIDFGRQTWQNRELVIAVTDPRYAEQIAGFLDARSLGAPARVIQRDQRTQNDLLLHAQAAATGALLAVWDDDNLNAPERLELQAAAMKTQAAVLLTDALYFFYDTAELFVVGFEQPAARLSERTAPTSLLVPRAVMPAWPFVGKTQSVVAAVADQLTAKYKLRTTAVSVPYAHLIGVRGDNLRGYEYHRKLATSLPLAKKAGDIDKAAVTAALDAFSWDQPKVTVTGADGVAAFEYTPKKLWSEEGGLYPVGDPKDGVVRSTEKVG